MAELSDAEVFGSGEMSDAAVFGKEMSDSDVGLTSMYWSAPRLEAGDKPVRMTDLITHPVASAQALARRFGAVREDTEKHGTLLGVAAGGVADTIAGGARGPVAAALAKDTEKALRPREAKSAPEAVTDLGAGITGSLLSPESWVDAPLKFLQITGRPILSSILRRGVSNAVVNAATDPLVQEGNIARGVQEKYSPQQTAMAAATGFGMGAGFGAAPAAGKAVSDVLSIPREVDRAIPFKPEPVAAEPAPTTVWDVPTLWGRLVRQESGGDQGAESKKGARGVAQLMPDTAEYMANKLGNPKLADIAMEDSPRGKVANEMLGQAYLNEQLHTFDGNPMLALAAYNAGPARVHEWIARFGHPDSVGAGRWMAMIPFEETRNYVRTILGKEAPPEHVLTPEEHDFLRAKTDGFPDDPEAVLPPLEGEPELYRPPEPSRAGEDLAKSGEEFMDSFPGDRPAGEAGERSEGMPWDEDAPTEASEPPARGPDLTDQALDQMRSGKPVQMAEGPSLIEFLVKQGGIRDESGEVSAILGGQGENRLFKQLRKVNGGVPLDEATLRAWQEGYLGPKPDTGAARPEPQALKDAIAREVGGKKVVPEERVNPEARALRDHIQDLDEVLQHIGMDPKTHTNAEIREAMDRFFREAADEEELEPGSMGIMGLKPGDMGNEKLAKALAARDRVRDRMAVMATTRGGLLGQRKPTAIPAGAGDVPEVRGIHDISRQLRTDLDIPVRQGRLGLRGALGTYNRRSGMVRTKQMQELDVLSHEIGHALEYTRGYPNVAAVLKLHARRLKDMDYNPNRRNRGEGFAEWLRWYVTNPEYARQRAPGFAKDFESALATDAPKDLAALQRAQQDYQAFLEAPSLAATKAQVVRPARKGSIPEFLRTAADKGVWAATKDVGNEVYRSTVDFLNPWKRAVEGLLDIHERRTGQRPVIAAVADPYKLLRSMPAVASSGHMDLIHGVHGYHSLTPDSPSFVEALALALEPSAKPLQFDGQERIIPHATLFGWDEKAIDEFGTYLAARRVVHLYDSVGKPRGLEQPPDILSREAWQQTIEDSEARNPQWPEAAQMIYEYNNAGLRKDFDAGLITEKEYLDALDDHPDYVPLFRDISDKEFGDSGDRGSSTKGAGGLIRLKGSARAYINPLHSIMDMTYERNARIAVNDALKALDDLGQLMGPDAGRIVERIPAKDLKGTQVNLDEVIENIARQYGVSRRDARVITQSLEQIFQDQGLETTIYRSVDTKEKGEPIAYVWRDGERIPLRLPDGKWGRDMVESLAGMTRPVRSLALDLMSIPARVLRGGVTANPAFFVANTIRDQLTAAILTDVGYLPFFGQAKGLKHELTQDDISRIYNVVGGEIGGQQTAAENAAHGDRNLQALRQKGARIKHFASWDGLAKFTELSETGTRQGIFEATYRQARQRGMSDYAAAKEAAFEARDYMDFDRRGAASAMKVAIRVIPFLNAGIQALDKSRRVAGGIAHLPKVIGPLFGKPPATEAEQRAFTHAVKFWSAAAIMGAAGAALRAAYQGDPEWQEAADYLRNTHWVLKAPNGELWVVPKPYDIALLSNIMERAYEGVTLHDPTAGKRLLQGMGDILVPAHDITAIMPIWNLSRNRDQFGSPIVPDNMLHGDNRVQARDQYTDRTSGVAKALGNAAPGEGMSPAQIEYLMKSYGGSNVRDALAASEALAGNKAPMGFKASDTPVLQRFVKDWTRGSISGKQFWDLTGGEGKWTALAGSVRNDVREGRLDKAADFILRMKPEERAYTLLSVFGQGQQKQTHPLIRAQEAYTALNGMAMDLVKGDVRGPTLEPIRISKDERRAAVDALHKMATAEQRNALIAAGVPGWVGKQPLPTDRYVQDFARAAPELVPALAIRYADVAPANSAAAAWAAQKGAWEAKPDRATLMGWLQAKRFPKGKVGFERAIEDVAPAPR